MSAELAVIDNGSIEKRRAIGITARGISLQTFEDVWRFATVIAQTPFAPRDFKTPESIAVAIAYGLELGLSPMQSLQNVAVINGKPSVYGDGMVAIVRASGLLADMRENTAGEGDERTAICQVLRVGSQTPRVETFSVKDAKRAGLWGKAGPWSTYPNRMLKMRARSWALRDEFADILKGVIAAEEAQDFPEQKPVTGNTDDATAAYAAHQATVKPVKSVIAAIHGLAERAGIQTLDAWLLQNGFPIENELSAADASAVLNALKPIAFASKPAEPEAIDAMEEAPKTPAATREDLAKFAELTTRAEVSATMLKKVLGKEFGGCTLDSLTPDELSHLATRIKAKTAVNDREDQQIRSMLEDMFGRDVSTIGKYFESIGADPSNLNLLNFEQIQQDHSEAFGGAK